jgi:ATP-dependent Clp protease protease subunit
MRRSLSRLLAIHTEQDFERIETDVERDRYFSAAQAQEYGIIDKVISSRDQAPETAPNAS